MIKVRKPPQRYGDMNRDYPKRKDGEGYWLCRWCGCRLVEKRRTSFCSIQCRDEVRIRCGFAVRSMVRRRDRGVCKKCGRNTAALRRELNKLWKTDKQAFSVRVEELEVPEDRYHGALWEADHIVPVREGGGQCGLEGFQTLCIWCHREKNKNSAKKT